MNIEKNSEREKETGSSMFIPGSSSPDKILSELSKIDMSQNDSNNTAITSSLDSSAEQCKQQPFKYRPNNSFVKIRIEFWNPDFHLPVKKLTGKNTWKEYLYWPNATFERAIGSRWLIAHIKRRKTWLVEKDLDVDDANREYTDLAMVIVKAFEEMNKDKVKLDYTNFKHQIKEFEIKHRKIDLPRDLRFRDTVGKKVYSTGIEYYSPIAVKNTINNLAVRDELPEIKQTLAEFSRQLQLHLKVQNETLNTMKVIQNSLKPKESSYQKLKNFIFNIRMFIKKV